MAMRIHITIVGTQIARMSTFPARSEPAWGEEGIRHASVQRRAARFESSSVPFVATIRRSSTPSDVISPASTLTTISQLTNAGASRWNIDCAVCAMLWESLLSNARFDYRA
jgi:putative N-acetylmannosamine-6-phosphate epimerase